MSDWRSMYEFAAAPVNFSQGSAAVVTCKLLCADRAVRAVVNNFNSSATADILGFVTTAWVRRGSNGVGAEMGLV
jgi:hypothetical protein